MLIFTNVYQTYGSEMSFDIDGCTASLAHTHVLAEKVTGKTADVVAAVGAAKGSVLRVIKPGMTVSFSNFMLIY